MTALHTGCQQNVYEGLDAKLIAGVKIEGDAMAASSDLVDKYKDLQYSKDMTIETNPLVSTPHTILSKWLLDNRIVDIKAMRLLDTVTATGSKAVDAAFICTPYPSILVSSRKTIREHYEVVKQKIKIVRVDKKD
ncbi:MAG: hypothetical protein LAKADJCE_00032 [Candidatus Argoarchaeum ethanivorans]|uniref:Uncharacterized protein n=1 Tax=Candidatus Argoarchaeum ethanivorans TaxID=2608793 RepID=A0A811T8D0_9EURY|nr:MAG: hypothetical protein LAKADJCE_00032 [Candidatus Argoarchaeum ethanivorans]